MFGKIVEERSYIAKDLLRGRDVLMQDRHQNFVALLKNVIERSAIKRLLVAEVVIEQSLVDLGRARNRIGTGAGHSFACELADRCLQDRGAALFGLSPGPQSRPGMRSCHKFPLLTNRLVR